MTRGRIAVGLVAALCAFAALSSTSFAEPPVFGKFKASTSNTVKGIGEEGEMVIGPYKFPKGCEKELKAKGSVEAGEHEVITMNVKFPECIALRDLGQGLEEAVKIKFTMPIEFHSAGFIVIGPTSFKASHSQCEIKIPKQFVPASAEKSGEKHEFEKTSYSTEKEKQTTKGGIKKFGEFRERLFIEWEELKGIDATAPITPVCQYTGNHENKETKEAEFLNGKMEEGELEEVTLKEGNLSFIP
jgi:hypothetical protein